MVLIPQKFHFLAAKPALCAKKWNGIALPFHQISYSALTAVGLSGGRICIMRTEKIQNADVYDCVPPLAYCPGVIPSYRLKARISARWSA